MERGCLRMNGGRESRKSLKNNTIRPGFCLFAGFVWAAAKLPVGTQRVAGMCEVYS